MRVFIRVIVVAIFKYWPERYFYLEMSEMQDSEVVNHFVYSCKFQNQHLTNRLYKLTQGQCQWEMGGINKKIGEQRQRQTA